MKNKSNKLIVYVLTLLCAFVFITMPISATTQDIEINYVMDEADVLTETDINELADYALFIETEYGFSPYILIVDDWKSLSTDKVDISDIAEQFYNENNLGYGDDGKAVILLYDNTTYEVGCVTFGENIETIITDEIYDLAFDAFVNGETIYDSIFDFLFEFDYGLDRSLGNSSPADSSKIEINYVMDEAGVLTDEEIAILEEKAKEIEIATQITPYILTIDDMSSISTAYDAFDVVYDFYHENNLGYGNDKDGIILMLSMYDRDYGLLVNGELSKKHFSEKAQIKLEDKFLDDFGNDNWYTGFKDYLNSVEFQIKSPFLNSLTNNIGSILLSLIIAFIIASIIGGSYKNALKSVKTKTTASDYVDTNGGVDMHIREDVYTHTTTVRRKIEKSSSSSGGGSSHSRGSSSGRSGKF